MLPEAPALGALNHLLNQADWARERLRPFAGRNARIATPLLSVNFTIQDDGTVATVEDAGSPDVEIVLPVPLPTDLLTGPEALFARARINGTADFAETLGFVLRNLTWDVEEDLSRFVGDIAAHRLTETMRSLTAWGRQATRNLVDNVTEYLTEEQPTLAKGPDLAELHRQISTLERQLAQLDARLKVFR